MDGHGLAQTDQFCTGQLQQTFAQDEDGAQAAFVRFAGPFGAEVVAVSLVAHQGVHPDLEFLLTVHEPQAGRSGLAFGTALHQVRPHPAHTLLGADELGQDDFALLRGQGFDRDAVAEFGFLVVEIEPHVSPQEIKRPEVGASGRLECVRLI